MKIGFTGTQVGLTPYQAKELLTMLTNLDYITEFHHGDCIGADKMACLVAQDFGIKIIGHPPDNPVKRCYFESDEEREEKPYLKRNKDIVNESDILIACPKGPEELRSGTWSTVRYARKVGVPVLVISPGK